MSRGVSVQSCLCPKGYLSRGVSVQGGLCPESRVVSVQRGISPGRSLSRGSLSRGVSIQWGLCPGGSLSSGVSVQGGLCPELSLTRRIFAQGVSVQGVSVRKTPVW